MPGSMMSPCTAPTAGGSLRSLQVDSLQRSNSLRHAILRGSSYSGPVMLPIIDASYLRSA